MHSEPQQVQPGYGVVRRSPNPHWTFQMDKYKFIFLSLIFLIAIPACNDFRQIGQNNELLQPSPEEQEIPKTQVVVALEPISRGEEFSESSIGYREWPINNIPPDTVFDKTEAIGHISTVDIVEGQLIVRSMFENAAVQDKTQTMPAASQVELPNEQEVFTVASRLFGLYACFFLTIVIIQISSGLWTVYEEKRMTRLKGKTKRGIKVWTEVLDKDIFEFLRTLPNTIFFDEKFIYKYGSGMLIGEIRRVFFPRGIYLGYVDLDRSKGQIEYRVAKSRLIFTISTFVMISAVFVFFGLILFSLWWFSEAELLQLGTMCFTFPLFLLILFSVSILFIHWRDRKRLFEIINRAKNKKTV
jgi:hypothetical protein